MAWWRGACIFLLAVGLAACGGKSSRLDGHEMGGDGGTTSSGGATYTTGGSAGAAPTTGGSVGAAPTTGGTGFGGTSGVGGTECSYNGNIYVVGDTFPAADDCNTCTCTPEGIACTAIDCPGDECERLRGEYDAALSRAKSCDPAQVGPRCQRTYPSSLICGCETHANDDPEFERYYAYWLALGCPQPPCPPCDPPTGAYCSELGRCEDTWGRPQCDGLLVTPSPVCDYGVPCSEGADCVSGDCYVPGGRTNPICSKRCLSASGCPVGSACIEVGGDGSHCFVQCTSNEFCQTINAIADNPLECVSFGSERVCIQSSEP